MPVFFCSRKDIQAGDKQNKNKHLTSLFYAWPAVEQRQPMHSWTSRLPAVFLSSMEAASNIQKPRVKSGVSTAATVCTFHVVFLIFNFFFTLLPFLVNSAVTEPFVNCMDGEKWKPVRRWTHFGEMILYSEEIHSYAVRAFCCHALNALVSAERMLQNYHQRP